jgi:hypothetical protein
LRHLGGTFTGGNGFLAGGLISDFLEDLSDLSEFDALSDFDAASDFLDVLLVPSLPSLFVSLVSSLFSSSLALSPLLLLALLLSSLPLP